jgi:hypothetical protein
VLRHPCACICAIPLPRRSNFSTSPCDLTSTTSPCGLTPTTGGTTVQRAQQHDGIQQDNKTIKQSDNQTNNQSDKQSNNQNIKTKKKVSTFSAGSGDDAKVLGAQGVAAPVPLHLQSASTSFQLPGVHGLPLQIQHREHSLHSLYSSPPRRVLRRRSPPHPPLPPRPPLPPPPRSKGILNGVFCRGF